MELGQCLRPRRLYSFQYTDTLQARQALFTIMRPLQKGGACLSDHI
jgi:hypothetical protein